MPYKIDGSAPGFAYFNDVIYPFYFICKVFYNTVFLLDEDNFDSLSSEEQLKRGFDCPCQFGVVHGLLPTEEEMALKESRDYPYSIYV